MNDNAQVFCWRGAKMQDSFCTDCLNCLCGPILQAAIADPFLHARYSCAMESLHREVSDYKQQSAALKCQRDELLEALKHYGRHQVMGEMCAFLAHGDNPCTCGLDAAIAAVEGEK